jgi:hypothetical protein
MKIRRPSHKTVVAYLALFIALGGSAYAVTKVGTADLKNGAVTSPKIQNRTITGRDIKSIVIREGERNVLSGNTALSSAVARCHRHEELIGTGGGWISDGNVTSTVADRRTNLVQVRGTNPDGSADTLLAQAVCLRK